jgi:hypothetical protein
MRSEKVMRVRKRWVEVTLPYCSKLSQFVKLCPA